MTVPNDSINSILWTSPIANVIKASSPVTLLDAYAVIRSTPPPVASAMCICHIRDRIGTLTGRAERLGTLTGMSWSARHAYGDEPQLPGMWHWHSVVKNADNRPRSGSKCVDDVATRWLLEGSVHLLQDHRSTCSVSCKLIATSSSSSRVTTTFLSQNEKIYMSSQSATMEWFINATSEHMVVTKRWQNIACYIA